MCHNPLISAADLAFAFADIGERVVSPMSTTHGVYRLKPTMEITDGNSYQRNVHTLLIGKGTIADLRRELEITVGGKPFVVQQIDDIDDGFKTSVLIAPVTK
jgi:hypothetical protein